MEIVDYVMEFVEIEIIKLDLNLNGKEWIKNSIHNFKILRRKTRLINPQ